MKLAIITPIGLMDAARKLSSISMYYYHLMSNEKYLENYQKDQNYKILDNSVFELKQLPPDKEYLDLIEKVRPDEVVAPDVQGDHDKTLEKTLEFVKQLQKRNLPNIKVQAVLHAKTMKEAIDGYKRYSGNPDISCIGFPVVLDFKHQGRRMRREELIHHLIDEGLFNESKEHHLLGLNSMRELIDLSKTGKIRSCDGRLFYAHARDAVDYSKPEAASIGRSKVKVDLFDPHAKEHEDRLTSNIKVLKRRLNQLKR